MQLSSVAVVFAVVVVVVVAGCGSSGGTTPTGPVVAKVVIASTQSALVPGKQLQLSASAQDASGVIISSPGTIAWSSSVTTVATISQTGLLTAVAAGSTTISATVGGVSGTMNVVVSPVTTATKDTVFALANTFSPGIVSIAQGQSVTFVFGGGIEHDVTFRAASNPPGAPPNILVSMNQLFSRTFNSRGTFNYDCMVHPGMSGQVVVQ